MSYLNGLIIHVIKQYNAVLNISYVWRLIRMTLAYPTNTGFKNPELHHKMINVQLTVTPQIIHANLHDFHIVLRFYLNSVIFLNNNIFVLDYRLSARVSVTFCTYNISYIIIIENPIFLFHESENVFSI